MLYIPARNYFHLTGLITRTQKAIYFTTVFQVWDFSL